MNKEDKKASKELLMRRVWKEIRQGKKRGINNAKMMERVKSIGLSQPEISVISTVLEKKYPEKRTGDDLKDAFWYIKNREGRRLFSAFKKYLDDLKMPESLMRKIKDYHLQYPFKAFGFHPVLAAHMVNFNKAQLAKNENANTIKNTYSLKSPHNGNSILRKRF